MGVNDTVGEVGELIVSVKKEEVVVAELPMQEHLLPLSNLDLLIPPLDVTVFFCYKKPLPTCFAASLKHALSQALVYYYPFAGQVLPNSMGEPQLFCSNRGVDFVEAVADDVELQCLDLYNPDHTIQAKLAPTKNHGVLAVQATQLKCGGLVVACTFDHRIADAYSANMFLVSWAELAQPNKKPIMSTQPYCQRSLLVPRNPPCIHASLHDMYVPISALPPPSALESEPLISRIYYLTGEHVNHMQELASSEGVKRTKLESFSAFLWKLVAEASGRVNKGKKKKLIAKMGVVVDGRKRLSNGDRNMGSYFGNVVSIPYGGKPVEELVEKPLSWVAEKVHEFLEMAVTEDHFSGLVDWVEAHRPVPGLSKIYCGGSEEEGPRFVVSSGQRFPVSKVDFGWGKPVFASYHFPWGGDAGYVMPMPCATGNGDWLVYMHLRKTHLNFIDSRASQFFKPFSWDYILNCP